MIKQQRNSDLKDIGIITNQREIHTLKVG